MSERSVPRYVTRRCGTTGNPSARACVSARPWVSSSPMTTSRPASCSACASNSMRYVLPTPAAIPRKIV